MLVNTDVSDFPDFNYPFIPETNATLKGYGAILYIDEKRIGIGYARKKIKPVMQEYRSFKLEFQAMHCAITKKFHHYLISYDFQVPKDGSLYAK